MPVLKEGVTWEDLRKPELRDPRAYIIPADQPDFPTAVKFINALREVNVTVHRATADFTVADKKYPVGSFVVFTAQAFRPHVLDMFEPQDHPNVIPYPGAAPTPPYDNAGWTLAFQMGVKFDRILEPFTGPFERVPTWNVRPPQGRVGTLADATGYTLSRATNDAFRAVNRLMVLGEQVSAAGADFLLAPSTGHDYAAAESGGGARCQLPTREGRLRVGAATSFAIPHRSVGPVRRLYPVGMDAMDPGAIRVSVLAGVRARARCRQSERQVRRPDFRGWRDPARDRTCRGRPRWWSRRRPARGVS